MIGGWHWRGRSGVAADWLPPPGGEATFLKIAAPCDDRGRLDASHAVMPAEERETGGLTVGDSLIPISDEQAKAIQEAITSGVF
jgi:hypothetical protein